MCDAAVDVVADAGGVRRNGLTMTRELELLYCISFLFACESVGMLLSLPRWAALLLPCEVLAAKLLRMAGGKLFRAISRDNSETSRAKFEDRFSKFINHALQAALGGYILHWEGGGKPWIERPTSLFADAGPISSGVRLLYVLQATTCIASYASLVGYEERRRDHTMMAVHHCCHLGLLWLSFAGGYTAIGCLVMYLHDASDIFTSLTKLFNYLKFEGSRGLYLTEISFFVNLFTCRPHDASTSAIYPTPRPPSR